MNEHDELADLFPPDRPVTPERRRELKERLMVQVREAEQTGRRRYRAIAGGVAAAVLVAAGLAVLLTRDGSGGDSGPDAGDRVDVAGNGEGEDPGDGDERDPYYSLPEPLYRQVQDNLRMRPQLDAERVGCVAPGGVPLGREVGASTSVTDIDLEDPLTRDDLIEACASTTERSEPGGDPWDLSRARTCVREGGWGGEANTRDDSYPLAVVTLDDLPCEEAGGEVTVRDMTDADLDQLNRMRDMEVLLLSDPRPCPTAEEGEQWARDQIAELDLDAELLIDHPANGRESSRQCWWPRAFWNASDGAPEPAYGLVVTVTRVQEPVEPPEGMDLGEPLGSPGSTEPG